MSQTPFHFTIDVSRAGRASDVDDVVPGDFIGYFRAIDIVEDPALAPSRKKALLAYWASDANAVLGAPGLRNVRGVTVTIDSLFEAMARVDDEIDPAAIARRSGNPQASL